MKLLVVLISSLKAQTEATSCPRGPVQDKPDNFVSLASWRIL